MGWSSCSIAVAYVLSVGWREVELETVGEPTTLTITLIGNMPINLREFGWHEEHGDPHEWRRLRRRWHRLHKVRIPLDLAGLILITLAALHA
jgi:hypothetical protein